MGCKMTKAHFVICIIMCIIYVIGILGLLLSRYAVVFHDLIWPIVDNYVTVISLIFIEPIFFIIALVHSLLSKNKHALILNFIFFGITSLVWVGYVVALINCTGGV